MKTYAIADLHGRFDLLEMAIASIEAGADGGKVVFLGDYVDRGPQSRQIIDRLMAGPQKTGWQWICLRGNHEDIMVACCETVRLIGSWWIPNGGARTLMSYGAKVGDDAIDAAQNVPAAHLEWMKALPRMHIDAHRVFVHAGVDPLKPLDQQDDQDLGWKLYDDDDGRGHGERHVVHGHHQFEDGPILLAGRTDLDTFAWFTGRLVVGVFDDEKPGGPVDLVVVQGPHIQDIRKAS